MGEGRPSSGPGTWRLCTPPTGTGAIAVVQVAGDVDAALVRLGIRPVADGAICLRDLAGVDRGLVARVGRTQALLMPHGGPAVVRRLCSALAAAGLVPAEEAGPEGAFPEARSWLEARMLATLARAASPRAVDLLLDQPRRWAAWGCPEPGQDTTAPDPAHSAALDRLVDPPMVVAAGAANIGKSTLLNRLAGRAVVAVADEPGTTRDHVGALVEVDGLVVRYVDTPGVRPAATAVEREAGAAAAAVLAAADLTLLLGDGSAEPPEGHANARAVRVAIRSDLGRAAWPHELAVSALTGEGLADLRRLVRRALVPDEALASPLPWRFWPDSRAGPVLDSRPGSAPV